MDVNLLTKGKKVEYFEQDDNNDEYIVNMCFSKKNHHYFIYIKNIKIIYYMQKSEVCLLNFQGKKQRSIKNVCHRDFCCCI